MSSKIFSHVPHPHIHHRQAAGPTKVADHHDRSARAARFNTFLALKITAAVGTMWCAYVFAGLALISLPEAIRGGAATTVTWTAQTFLQLVLLSIIIVGQNVQARATDARAQATYEDANAVLHTALAIQEHMEAQDNEIERILEEVLELRAT